MTELNQSLVFIAQGILLTLELLIGGVLIGVLFGTILAILRFKRIGVFFIKRFVSVMRGTPLILQLSFVYFAIPNLTGIRPNILFAGILTFGLNSSAYLAEMLRSGMDSIPKGQFEAAKTLQIPDFHLWKDIILPQVLKNILPSLTNETIALLKETALISTIGGMDIMRKAQSIAAEQFTYFLPLCIAGAYYYCLVLLIEHIGKTIERGRNYAAS